jgi:hypothetical protein
MSKKTFKEIREKMDEIIKRQPSDEQLEDLKETLSEEMAVTELLLTLELIAAPARADGTYNRSREACQQLAREVLDRYYNRGKK